ncbi:MAG: superoxide dismutase [Deltaproteobacteria bacterium]|nr:superoxide dismutase [Deltaproteobacteria bacterium]
MKIAMQHIVLSILTCLTLAACTGENRAIPPDLIPLPNAFQPEGIAARGNSIYVGSIPSGAVYRADITTGEGSVLVPSQAGRAAIGLKVDGRGRIFVAGGGTGKAFVYDAATGQDLASHTLTQATPTFVNDVVLTADAAWFTDSRNPALYRVPLPADGTLAGQDAVSTLALSGDFQFVAGVNNLNGIASTGQLLIAVQSNTGLLFTVDPATGVTKRIDLGSETVVNGDGILLEGQTLFVLQNRLNQVAVIDLSADLATGTVRTRITNPSFDVPTTLTAAGTSLYAVNARFGVQVTPDTTYTVVRFNRP